MERNLTGDNEQQTVNPAGHPRVVEEDGYCRDDAIRELRERTEQDDEQG